jgi:hypothetical protein
VIDFRTRMFFPLIRKPRTMDATGAAGRREQGRAVSGAQRGLGVLSPSRDFGNISLYSPAYAPGSPGKTSPEGGDTPGRPLDSGTRNTFERRFGHDFSQVRVHADGAVSESARVLHARAYTVGPDIVFAPNQFAPNTRHGARLLGHELAHVVQQTSAAGGPMISADTAESEAEAVSDAIDGTEPVRVSSRTHTVIACAPDDGRDSGENEYERDTREDKAAASKKGKGPAEKSSLSPKEVANDVKNEISTLVEDAKSGKYSSASLKTKTQLLRRFHRLREGYRSDEIAEIDRQLGNNPSGPPRKALINRKRGITAERSRLQGEFDEALRTPKSRAGLSVQKPIVRGADAKQYHETTPGKGSYFKPDYSLTPTSAADGTTRLHVNLKSNALRDVTPAEATNISRDVLQQAVKNAQGAPVNRPGILANRKLGRYGDVGHLPETEKIVISFGDQPSPEIQKLMADQLLQDGSPIVEVRFGPATFRRRPPSGVSSVDVSTKAPRFTLKSSTSSPAAEAFPTVEPVRPASTPATAPSSAANTVADVEPASPSTSLEPAIPAEPNVASGAQSDVSSTMEQALAAGRRSAKFAAIGKGLLVVAEVVGTFLSAYEAVNDFQEGDYLGGGLNSAAAAGLVLPELGAVAGPYAAAWESEKAALQLEAWEGQCRVLAAKFETGTITSDEFDSLAKECPPMMIGTEEWQRVERAALSDEWPEGLGSP